MGGIKRGHKRGECFEALLCLLQLGLLNTLRDAHTMTKSLNTVFLRPQCSRQTVHDCCFVFSLLLSIWRAGVFSCQPRGGFHSLAWRWTCQLSAELQAQSWGCCCGAEVGVGVGSDLLLALDSYLRGVFPCILPSLCCLSLERGALWGFQLEPFFFPRVSETGHHAPVGTEKAFSRDPAGTAYFPPWKC